MNQILKIVTFSIIAFFSTSCATLFGGSMTQNLSVDSSTPVEIKVIDEKTSESVTRRTPFNYEIRRDHNYSLKIISSKYTSQDIKISKQFRKLSVLNYFFPPGIAVDFVTGAMWEHSKVNVFIDTKDLQLKKAMADDTFEAKIQITATGMDEYLEPSRVGVTFSKVKFYKNELGEKTLS